MVTCLNLLPSFMQFEKRTVSSHPRLEKPAALTLDDGDEVTESIVLTSLRRALDRMSALQADDGHWPGDFSGIMYLLPFWVSISLCI